MRHSTILAAVSLALSTQATFAQINEWIAGSGNWYTPSSWDEGYVPVAGEHVRVNNGATVFYTSGVTPDLASIYLGTDCCASNGVLDASGGRINTAILFVGYNYNGTMLISGSAKVDVSGSVGIGSSLTSSGAMTINGGQLEAGSSFSVGNTGVGSFDIISGLLTVGGFSAGNSSSAAATINFQGGTVECKGKPMSLGNMGSAIVTIGECDITAGSIDSGNGTTGTGTTTMTGGSVLTSNIRLAGAGATWTQSGGDVWATAYIRLGGVGTCVYNFEGGTLKTGSVQWASPLFEFNMSGGTFSLNGFGQPSEPMNLSPTGGIISPGFFGTYQDAKVYGNLSLPAGVGLEIDLAPSWPFLNDSIEVEGTVALGATLALQLNIPPAPGDTVVIIDNDGADPIVGTFDGLPEGSTIIASEAGNDYEFIITYIGGDGNDVQLTSFVCLADFNNDGFLDSGDISAFVTLFLTGDLAADFTNDGFLDTGDINAFIALYLAGC